MIEEAVAAVKKTEGQADELLRQAGQDSAEILKEAKAEAEELKAYLEQGLTSEQQAEARRKAAALKKQTQQSSR